MCLFFESVDTHSLASKGRKAKRLQENTRINSFATHCLHEHSSCQRKLGLVWTEAGLRGMGLRKLHAPLSLVIVVKKAQSPLHLKNWMQLVCTRVRHKKRSAEISVSKTWKWYHFFRHDLLSSWAANLLKTCILYLLE